MKPYFDPERKLLDLHGITKQVRIQLCRVKVPSGAVQITLSQSQNSTTTEPIRRRINGLYPCSHPNCDYKSVQYYRVREHMTKHSNQRPYKCQVCSKAFKSSWGLRSHNVIHSKEKKFACPFPGCNKKFHHACTLKTHSYTHTGEKPFECSECGYRSRQKGHLNEHMQLHGAPGKKYYCDKCNFVSIRSDGLQDHSRRMHPELEEKPFKCSQCKFASFLNGQLTEHLKIHSEDKTFRCTFCEYKSFSRSRLNSHMRTHTGEKPFSCSLCDYKAAYLSTVYKHFNVHHTKRLRNHKCCFCSKAFYSKKGLYSHMRTHTGEKPFFCAICGREFSHNNTKRMHEKSCKRRHGS